MPGDIVPFLATLSSHSADAVPSPADKLLIDMAELAHLTSLSVRTLRRMDAARAIPGRVAVGRRVLFQTEIIRAWVRAGLPGRKEWESLTRRESKR
jgi:predicted DNA-binding transcriptional regulator AlpA